MQVVADNRSSNSVSLGRLEFVVMVPIHQRPAAVLVTEESIHLESGDMGYMLHSEAYDRNAKRDDHIRAGSGIAGMSRVRWNDCQTVDAKAEFRRSDARQIVRVCEEREGALERHRDPLLEAQVVMHHSV